MVRQIADQFSPDQIILFGSQARGDAAELYASLADFPRPMDIVVSTSFRFERYRNVVNTVYRPASREGKVLYERAALRLLFGDHKTR